MFVICTIYLLEILFLVRHWFHPTTILMSNIYTENGNDNLVIVNINPLTAKYSSFYYCGISEL